MDLTGLLPQKFTPQIQGVRQINVRSRGKQEESHKQWEDKETTPNQKERRNSQKKVLNEKEASQLSDIEFKTMVIRKFNELTENCQKLQGSYEELTVNYINMKKDIGTINKSQKK